MQDKRNSKIEKGKLLMNRIMRPLSAPVETTWREVIDGLVPLQTQLIVYYESLGYRNLAGSGLLEDVRALTLATCKDDIANSITFLNILMHFGEHPEEEQAFRILTGAADTRLSMQKVLERMGEHLKRSMVTMIQFRLASMNKGSVSMSYTSNIDALLQSLQLPDTDRKNQILRILQYMRNTYHNNGTHLFGKPINVQIENYSFIFAPKHHHQLYCKFRLKNNQKRFG